MTSRKNDEYSYAENTISLVFNYINLKDSSEIFSCFETDGLMYCKSFFICNGQTKVFDGKSYGHYDIGHLGLLFSYGKNLC